MSLLISASEILTTVADRGRGGVRLSLILVLVFLVGALSTETALAEDRTINVLRHGVTTPLVLPEYTSQGVGYAALADIARPLGATVEVTDTRATFRLEGKSVELGLNDSQLYLGSKTVSLKHPVLPYEGRALVAMEDVVTVLRNGFEFGTPEAPPKTSALAVPDSEMESMESDALESIGGVPSLEEESDILGLESIELKPKEASEEASKPVERTPLIGAGGTFTLVIDPGHGGDDNGVVGSGGLTEKDLCLAVASALQRILKEEHNISAVLTRETDESLSPDERLQRATAGSATLVVSIHGGASTGTAAQGYRVFAHQPLESLSIDPKPALGVAESLASTLDSITSQPPRPIREIPMRLMRQGTMPGVLIELGNLVNPDEEAQLATSAHQELLASALAQGIKNAVGSSS